jgi:hypothetical protein
LRRRRSELSDDELSKSGSQLPYAADSESDSTEFESDPPDSEPSTDSLLLVEDSAPSEHELDDPSRSSMTKIRMAMVVLSIVDDSSDGREALTVRALRGFGYNGARPCA